MSSVGIGSRISTVDGLSAVDARAFAKSVAPTVEAAPRAASVAPVRDSLASFGAPLSGAVGATTNGDPPVVARVSSEAKAGAHSVEVSQLAKPHRSESSALASSTSPLGMAGSIELRVGDGVAHAIAVAREDSLLDVAVKINTSGAGVDASVVFQGGAYKLSLRGPGSGASNAVSIQEAGVALGLSDPGHIVQVARDARVRVDGREHTAPTNQIEGAIPGVTLAVAQVTKGATTLRIGGDDVGSGRGAERPPAIADPTRVRAPASPHAHARTALERLHRLQRVPAEHHARALGPPDPRTKPRTAVADASEASADAAPTNLVDDAATTPEDASSTDDQSVTTAR